MIASSAAWSTSETKSCWRLARMVSLSTSKAARVMIVPALRAACTAVFSMGCIIDFTMALRVVLSHPSHPGNIGAAARAMKTMGYDDLVLVAPRHFPDPDATALAAGAADVLAAARVCDTLEAALADCTHAAGLSARVRELSHPPKALREAAPALVRAAAQGTLALVFGNETSGLSNAELAL